MAQTTLTIRIDEGVKKKFEWLCNELGLNLSVAITAFAKESVRENRLPLSLSADPFYSKSNMDFLRRAAADMDAGRNVSEHELIEVDG
ncbi:MAG: type II toxin-antitoxin system RelB/DinJ family antitoxin [Oscillospiraceae bacterium]|nr:type II toxin-antitoxin system RelB/DinJ family antitoxin [Oscillospiraceae bacterium]